MAKLDTLEPKIVWTIFEEISKIPRCSGKEQGIQDWLESWARKHDLAFKKDDVGNILISKNASNGCENYPVVVLQSHQDMVCEKNIDSSHNFSTDPIPLKVMGNTVRSDGTSLGADNGIGLAISLALLIDPTLENHGKVEVLTTVEEETGLRGALNMKPGFFTGKYMINLDSEEAGVVIIGSAGGSGTQYSITFSLEPTIGWVGFKLDLVGLLGGHSGVDIGLPRANAIKVIGECLMDLKNIVKVRLVQIDGGTRGNAIPRSASCSFMVPLADKEKVGGIVSLWEIKTREKYPVEADFKKSFIDYHSDYALTEQKTETVIGLINEIFNGVYSWSETIKGLVETSNNLGVISTSANIIKINILSRGSDLNDLRKDLGTLANIGVKYDAQVTQSPPSQGWKADPTSPLLKMVESVYEGEWGNKPKVTAIHGGLECGHLSKLSPGISALSIGPTIKYPHSPQEFVDVNSVGVVWRVINQIVARINDL